MSTPTEIAQALDRVRNQQTFVEVLLRDTLDWPIDPSARSVEDVTYPWSKDDLSAEDLDAKIVDGRVLQVQPFRDDQPWGIFILEFKSPEVFRRDRGMAGTLRRVLRGLVNSRRRRSDLRHWKHDNILFICNHRYEEFRFASFRSDPVQPSNIASARIAAFGWGRDDPARRTVCEFNLPHLRYQEGENPQAWIEQWTDAFDVERVTRQFYAEYRQVFEELESKLLGPRGEEQRRLAAQTLMNRLMFLRFVERKGWLTFNDRRDYLLTLAEAGGIGRKSLYRSRLEPLFFEALGSPTGDSTHRNQDAVGDVPFLGGGLFEETDLDKKLEDVPDAQLLKVIGPEGLFYRYNFTVEESTPLDVEVAVDPEMLGKVFEELVTGRHESGSYYTPRPVVAFMCREALKGFLTAKAGLDPDAAVRFVDGGDASVLDVQQARAALNALDQLKAVDPACGSGAYLLGLLHELVRLYGLLYNDKLKKDKKSLYEQKLQIISHSLYGVDIDSFATNIAMLRLWLSLSVEAESALSLPNLDFKIELGDSLLGPNPRLMPPLFKQQVYQEAERLVHLKDEYLVAQGAERAAKRAAIRVEEARIRNVVRETVGKNVVDWRVQFAEVFVKSDGFDIVLANPPYLSTKHGFGKDCGTELKHLYRTARGQFDAYALFLERALTLLADEGMYAYIVPKPILTNSSMRPIRALLAQYRITALADPGQVFEAGVEPVVIVGQRAPQATGGVRVGSETTFLNGDGTRLEALGRIITPAGAWNLAPKSRDFEMGSCRTLGEVAHIVRGIECGKKDSCITTVEQQGTYPLLRGEDVEPFTVHFRGYYVRRDKDEKKFKPLALYEGPQLLVRRVSNRPIAAIDPIGHHVLNTVYVVRPRPGSRCSPEYLCGILNSTRTLEYFQQMFINDDKLFPYIRKEQLETLPIPDPVPTSVAAIEGAVRTLITSPQSAPALTTLERAVIDAFDRSTGMKQEQ